MPIAKLFFGMSLKRSDEPQVVTVNESVAMNEKESDFKGEPEDVKAGKKRNLKRRSGKGGANRKSGRFATLGEKEMHKLEKKEIAMAKKLSREEARRAKKDEKMERKSLKMQSKLEAVKVRRSRSESAKASETSKNHKLLRLKRSRSECTTPSKPELDDSKLGKKRVRQEGQHRRTPATKNTNITAQEKLEKRRLQKEARAAKKAAVTTDKPVASDNKSLEKQMQKELRLAKKQARANKWSLAAQVHKRPKFHRSMRTSAQRH